MADVKNVHELQDELKGFKIITESNESPKDKPKVYFTCHEKDVGFFEDLCKMILDSIDCAVYRADNEADISEEEKETVLERMNLFVIPVTLNLLRDESDDCRAMRDVRYAKSKHTPILPIVMEPNLDNIYGAENKFGKRHYLKYDELEKDNRLAKHLDTVLISKKKAEMIRSAFAASIFLSYRKKDRKHADALIKRIHESERLRDIAVWFDDYLTPGENFEENIKLAMEKSRLFALLVTPSLLEKPNYVQEKEYPAARTNAKEKGIPILPVSAIEETASLSSAEAEEFRNMYRPRDEQDQTVYYDSIISSDDVRDKLIELLEGSRSDGIEDPHARAYLLGLAYLNGIDSEINHKIALQFITSSAESGNLDAMITLYKMYDEGIGVDISYSKTLEWCERITAHIKGAKSEIDGETLIWDDKLISEYINGGQYSRAVEHGSNAYELYKETIERKDPVMLRLQMNLATAYERVGMYEKAIELCERVYNIQLRVHNENHPDVITTMHELALIYCSAEKYDMAIDYAEKAYKLSLKSLNGDEEHPHNLIMLSDIALIYQKANKHKKAIEIGERAYKLCCDVFGDDHPTSLAPLSTLGMAYCYDGNTAVAKRLVKKAYVSSSKLLGKEHPDTLILLTNLAFVCYNEKDYPSAIKHGREAYRLNSKILSKDHPNTLLSLNNLAASLAKSRLYSEAAEHWEKAYELHRKLYGDAYEETHRSLRSLIETLTLLQKQKRAKGDISEMLRIEKRLAELKLEYIGFCKHALPD